MGKVTEIVPCQRCGKMARKSSLHLVSELFSVKALCKECYQKYHRSQWGYW